MTPIDRAAWDAFVEASDPGSYLQLGAWAEVKAVNGWTAQRIRRDDGIGAQVLVRRPAPLPWGFALCAARPRRRDLVRGRDRRVHGGRPRGPAASCRPRLAPADRPRDRARRTARPGRPAPPGAARSAAGDRRRRSSPHRRGSSTCTPDEDALWGDLRKKWRQYVNKARTAGVVVVDADGDRLGEFYAIYRDTADRAGFLIRTEQAYRDVWEAYRPGGRARLLFAQTADGEPLATLFLVRCGSRASSSRTAA